MRPRTASFKDVKRASIRPWLNTNLGLKRVCISTLCHIERPNPSFGGQMQLIGISITFAVIETIGVRVFGHFELV